MNLPRSAEGLETEVKGEGTCVEMSQKFLYRTMACLGASHQYESIRKRVRSFCFVLQGEDCVFCLGINLRYLETSGWR